VSLVFAGGLMWLYLAAKRHFPDQLGSQSLVMAFLAVVCFHSVYLELLPDDLRAWLFVIIMAAVAALPEMLSKGGKSGAYYIPRLAVLLVLGIEYMSMLFGLLSYDGSLFLVMMSLASMWAVVVRLEQRSTHGHTLLVAAHLLAIMGLYRLTVDVGSLAVSASWLCYAMAVMAFAFKRRDEVMAKSALFVLSFAAGKALLYDAASAPTVLRIFCLLMTGAVLYGSGLLMRRIAGWKQGENI
jgi:hypothetical protein